MNSLILKGEIIMTKNPIIKNNIVIENARIGFRNFSGEAGKFNPVGRRNFCVFLEPDMGKVLEEDGWNVRWLQPKDDGDEEQPYLQVAVSYDNIPPKIMLISKKGKTILDEKTVNILDWAEIESVDLIIRPYNWEVSGKSGVKAYIKAMYVTIVEDELESKYRNVPDSAADAIGGCGKCDACDGHCEHHVN
jgi:hypothetical protein